MISDDGPSEAKDQATVRAGSRMSLRAEESRVREAALYSTVHRVDEYSALAKHNLNLKDVVTR